MLLIGSDHAGFELKRFLISELKAYGIIDKGVFDDKSSDYPDVAKAVAKLVSQGEYKKAILICGSGVGMSITANRFKNVRAVLGNDLSIAVKSRQHNDTNILVLGSRFVAKEFAKDIAIAWLNAKFEDDERHIRRINKIEE